MLKITGGRYRGRTIHIPDTRNIRPTTGMMRESIFSRLQSHLPESRFLDLFAGSGVMGFEALSRGAAFVMAVEAGKNHGRWIRANREKLGISPDQHKLLTMDVQALASQPNRKAGFDIIYCDPPYGFRKLPDIVRQLEENGWVNPGGVILVEHGSDEAPLAGFERKTFGDSCLEMRKI